MHVRGGASRLEIDGRQIGAAAGAISLDSEHGGTATVRYDLQVTGGASELCVSA